MINKIAVITGGDSAEREIALKTCNAVKIACEKLGYITSVIELNKEIQSVIPKLMDKDFVFIALHGGTGENGIIQGLLDSLKLPYNGSGVLASALGMEKALTKTIARFLNIKTPNWSVYKDIQEFDYANSINNYPVVVKPSADGSTLGLSIVNGPNELIQAVKLANKFDGQILVEEFIEGRELTATIIGQKAYPIVEIVPTHGLYDYECKYKLGMSNYYCPADISKAITEQVQHDALAIYNAIQCRGYARADFILDKKGTPWFLEINTLPGMTETSLVPKAAKAEGIGFTDLIELIIQESIK